MGWIEEAKGAVKVSEVASWLGMTRRLRSIGPCPACGAGQRSRSDSRPPVGVKSTDDGWQCHACDCKGDSVELACHGVLGCPSSEAGSEGWTKLREWFEEHGHTTASYATTGRGTRAPAQSLGDMVSGIVGSRKKPEPRKHIPPAEPEPTPSGPAKMYGWEAGMVEASQAALWADSPEAEAARAYLLDVRKLSKAALDEFRIGLYVRNGRPVVNRGRPVVVIPILDDAERPVSAKFRSVPVPGSCDACEGVKGCRKCRDYRNCQGRPLALYGAHRLSSDLDMPVVLVEGELDVLAAYTYGLTVNVVSTTAGAGTFLDEWLDLLEPYGAFIGLYDADEKGEEGFKEVAEKLGAYRCARGIPPGGKDLGECLMSGVEAERISRAVDRAEPLNGLSMVKALAFAGAIERLVKSPELSRGIPTGWAEVDRMIGGVRPGVVVVSGETGQGKTTFTTALFLKLARAGHPGLLTSFEQQPEGTVQKLLRNEVEGDFTQVSEETRLMALENLGSLPLWILDHYGHITPTRMVETMRFAKRRHGIRFFLVDHLGFLCNPDAKDERREIEAVIRAMAIVAKQIEITIFLIAHPHNTGRDAKGNPLPVTMRDLKGASAIRQDADDILIVSQVKPSKDCPWPRSKIDANKIRSDFGISGTSCYLAFDPGSNTFADRWEETPAGRDGLLVPQARGR